MILTCDQKSCFGCACRKSDFSVGFFREDYEVNCDSDDEYGSEDGNGNGMVDDDEISKIHSDGENVGDDYDDWNFVNQDIENQMRANELSNVDDMSMSEQNEHLIQVRS